MSHGSPRINICNKCNQYTLVGRFSEDPECPDCGNLSEQTNKQELIRNYKLGILYEFILQFDHWQKIK